MKHRLEITIMESTDLGSVFKYAGQVVEQHMAFDPARFAILPNG